MTTEQRILRSKSQRALLWYAADGRCQACGGALGDDWEADHVEPWVRTHRTNVHEMQALCRTCNGRKGTSMLRAHQAQFDKLCREILAGRIVNEVYVGVTPGGGKSLLPVIAAQRLIPARADAICWVVPRTALQRQAEKNFLKRSFRDLLGHAHEIRQSTNDYNPARGRSGYVTTYQALDADRGLINAAEFKTKRYVLFLDEPHHCDEGGSWHKAVQPLIDRAILTVFMSGTWERGDGKKIANLPYEYFGGNKLRPAFGPDIYSDSRACIEYNRPHALRDQAIKPLHFSSFDGGAEWLDRAGQRQSAASLSTVDDDSAPDAIYTALRTEFAMQLLARCVGDWKEFRKHRSSGKLLVVAAGKRIAETYHKRLKEMGVASEIAHSDDSEKAQAAIERFSLPCQQPGALDVLVTVQMAYEGLDVPAITHLACLTHIRSRPWIEQMFGRACRVDDEAGPYEEQWGRVYLPDDPLMAACIKKIKDEQDAIVLERGERERQPSGPDEELQREAGDISPVASQIARERAFDLDMGQAIDHSETELLLESIRENGLGGLVDPLVFKRMMESYDAKKRGADLTPVAVVVPETPPSVRERRLRKDITDYTGRYESASRIPFGTLNSEVLRCFKTPRDEMTEEQLRKVWAWLHDIYPMP